MGAGGLFAWEACADPDNDLVTYRFEAALDPDFTTGIVMKEGLADNVVPIDSVDGLQDLCTYYWRVTPVDEYGASPEVWEVRQFTTDRNNPAVPGAIMGKVTNEEGDAIDAAQITVLPVDATGEPSDPYIDGPTSARRGSTVTMTMRDTGLVGEVGYQWYHEGSLIKGQYGATLTLEDIDYYHAGEYEALAWTVGKSQKFAVARATLYLEVMEEMPLAGFGLIAVIATLLSCSAVLFFRRTKGCTNHQ